MAIVMTAFLVIIIRHSGGRTRTELILIGTTSLFAVAFLYSAEKDQKILAALTRQVLIRRRPKFSPNNPA